MSYGQIAYHPLLDAPELRPAIDNLSYRARRILPSALAWILAAGNPAHIVQVYVLLNVAAWLALAALLWRILAVDDGRSWLAWAGILFSAGALGSVREALTDLIALTILVAGLFALERGRRRSALGWLAAAALTRETSLVALPGLCTRPWISWANVRRGALAAAPLAAWMLYVRWRVGPASQGWGNFNLIPGVGLAEKWRATLAIRSHNADDATLVWTTLVATAGLMAQAAYLLLRPRWDDPWWRLGAAYVALMLFLGTAVWKGYPGAAQRVLLPMSAAFFVLARRRRASWAWLAAGCLSVIAGFVYMRDFPPFPRDLAESPRTARTPASCGWPTAGMASSRATGGVGRGARGRANCRSKPGRAPRGTGDWNFPFGAWPRAPSSSARPAANCGAARSAPR